MKSTKELNTNKGITLISLVVTIIVMLLLVGVTISTVVDGGLFEQAGKAASETNEALRAEEELSKGKIQIGDEVYNSIEEYVNKYKGDNVEKISKETSYVGCYADVDGDGKADGVIYADLAFAKEGYYNAETGLKDYYVSGTETADFYEEAKEVLTAVGNGKDRFYVMALSDISTSQYTWYGSRVSDGITVSTSNLFGTGKENTENMITLYNKDTDETKSSTDIWGNLASNSKWFVPSEDEWIVFVKDLGIACGDTCEWCGYCYEEYGVSYGYWTSTRE